MATRKKKDYSTTIIFIVVMIIGFTSLISKSRVHHFPETISAQTHGDCTELKEFTSTGINATRIWQDYLYSFYCMDYTVKDQSYNSSRKFKNDFPVYFGSHKDSYAKIWGILYAEMINNDSELIQQVADSLQSLEKHKTLDRDQFADVVVTMVQDMEYVFILDADDCDDVNNRFDCVGNQKFGIHTPTEFMYTQQGDCDTRCLLLYGVLKELGYRPKIAVSDAYLHAMLLVDVSGPGDYLTHLGEKYYFWETTAMGWKPGILPPETGNKNNWEIALH